MPLASIVLSGAAATKAGIVVLRHPERRFRVPILRIGPGMAGKVMPLESRSYCDLPKLYTRLVVNKLSMCLVPGTMFEL